MLSDSTKECSSFFLRPEGAVSNNRQTWVKPQLNTARNILDASQAGPGKRSFVVHRPDPQDVASKFVFTVDPLRAAIHLAENTSITSPYMPIVIAPVKHSKR